MILPFGEYKNWEDLVAGITYEKLGNLSLNLARVWVWFFISANSSTSWSNKIRSPIRAKENITTNQNSKQKQEKLLKAREKVGGLVATGFSFEFDLFREWRELSPNQRAKWRFTFTFITFVSVIWQIHLQITKPLVFGF